jgi:hypothetical protein
LRGDAEKCARMLAGVGRKKGDAKKAEASQAQQADLPVNVALRTHGRAGF